MTGTAVATTSSPPRRHAKKKHQKVHDADTADAKARDDAPASRDPNSIVLEKRLFSARTTHRLDLGIATHRTNERLPHPLVPFQVFPRAILASGHHLRELWLTNHHISVVPPEIKEFSQLRVLDLAGNALSSLPDELTELPALESLYLERNAFRSIPLDVAFPRQLRDLRLDGNLLTAVPMQITQLRLLQRLGLSHNQLTSVPMEIRRLGNLVELDLDHNRITSDAFPNDAIARLAHLERLGLDGNRLSERPPCLLKMPSAKYVRLNGNCGQKDHEEELDEPPRRHDGYYQTGQKHGDTIRPLEGLVLSRAQNLVNARTYRSAIAQL